MNEFFTELLGNLGYGAIVAVIGILFVFIGLILIIAAIYAISAILKKLTGEKTEKATKAEAVPEPVQVAAPAETPVVEEIAPAEVSPQEEPKKKMRLGFFKKKKKQ